MGDTGHVWYCKEEKAGAPFPLGEPYCVLCGAYYEQAKDFECPNRQAEAKVISQPSAAKG